MTGVLVVARVTFMAATRVGGTIQASVGVLGVLGVLGVPGVHGVPGVLGVLVVLVVRHVKIATGSGYPIHH